MDLMEIWVRRSIMMKAMSPALLFEDGSAFDHFDTYWGAS